MPTTLVYITSITPVANTQGAKRTDLEARLLHSDCLCKESVMTILRGPLVSRN